MTDTVFQFAPDERVDHLLELNREMRALNDVNRRVAELNSRDEDGEAA